MVTMESPLNGLTIHQVQQLKQRTLWLWQGGIRSGMLANNNPLWIPKIIRRLAAAIQGEDKLAVSDLYD